MGGKIILNNSTIMLKKINKKSFLLVLSSSITLGIFVVNQVGTYVICGQDRDCAHVLANLITVLLPIVPVAFFSVVAYFSRKDIFETWFNFVKWAVPLSIILTVLTPETTGSAFLPFYGRGHVALATSIVFVIVSIGIIGWKYLRSRS